MPDGHKSRTDQRSLLWIALGRQRVGKTALLNAAVQYFRALGCHIEIWNADQQNRTHASPRSSPTPRFRPPAGW